MFNRLFKKADIVLLFALIAVGLLASVAVARPKSAGAGSGAEVVITVSGRECGRLPLDQDTSFTVLKNGEIVENDADSAGTGYNRVVIKGGTVEVTEADCRSQVCVDHKPIMEQGESIICLPHRLTVTIESGEGGGYDTIAQ